MRTTIIEWHVPDPENLPADEVLAFDGHNFVNGTLFTMFQYGSINVYCRTEHNVVPNIRYYSFTSRIKRTLS